ncbi:hypothetical protein GCM10009799_47590 [Nocardiopsis rhodophaea]|uniref:Uncharacterized protein n=1 Tax=Nocardiopsis rhodophaea TaxID=280238 RepID=A0ABP5F4R8_9ACTN
MRNLHLNHRTRGARWVIVPETIDQTFDRHLLSDIDEECTQHTALPRPANGDRFALRPGRNWTEYTKFHKWHCSKAICGDEK